MRFILENIVLFLACGGSFIAGVMLSSQWLRDKISGVSSDLRAALKAQEAAAVKKITDAHAAAIAQTVKAVAPAMPAPPAAGAPAAQA